MNRNRLKMVVLNTALGATSSLNRHLKVTNGGKQCIARRVGWVAPRNEMCLCVVCLSSTPNAKFVNL